MPRGGATTTKYPGRPPIKIKKSKQGTFRAIARKRGLSVQAAAAKILADPHASPAAKKKANFARNAARWKH